MNPQVTRVELRIEECHHTKGYTFTFGKDYGNYGIATSNYFVYAHPSSAVRAAKKHAKKEGWTIKKPIRRYYEK